MCKQHYRRALDPFLNGTKIVTLTVCVDKALVPDGKQPLGVTNVSSKNVHHTTPKHNCILSPLLLAALTARDYVR